MPFTRLRILDFFLLFPAELESMSFPRELLREKTKYKRLGNRYNRITDPRRVFDEIASFQISGVHILLSTGLIHQSTESEVAKLRPEVLPEPLVNELRSSTAAQSDLLKLLTGHFKSIELFGRDGLKARTGLFEYRYDPT
jgi:cell fate (sporulation/competence/biofilm development) regulator YmcA (YheA/YmcA/DUF963 family)